MTPVPAELQAEWDAKLRASGFVDIEPLRGDQRYLENHHLTTRGVMQRGWRTGGEAYAEVYQRWLLARSWPSRLERLMAACVAAGMRPSELAHLLPVLPARWIKTVRGWQVDVQQFAREHRDD